MNSRSTASRPWAAFSTEKMLSLELAEVKGEVNTFKGEERYAFELELNVFDLFETEAKLALERANDGSLIPDELWFFVKGEPRHPPDPAGACWPAHRRRRGLQGSGRYGKRQLFRHSAHQAAGRSCRAPICSLSRAGPTWCSAPARSPSRQATWALWDLAKLRTVC